MVMKISVYWEIALCSPTFLKNIYSPFSSSNSKPIKYSMLADCLCLFLLRLAFDREDGSGYSSEISAGFHRLHGVMSLKVNPSFTYFVESFVNLFFLLSLGDFPPRDGQREL